MLPIPRPDELRGTAFGMFNLVSGIAMLVASVVAGALWDIAGPAGTFLAGARIHRDCTGGASLRAMARHQDQAKLSRIYTTTVSFFAARVMPV